MMRSQDYDTVAEAIRFLKVEFRNQPSLEAVADHVGLSPFHFQRLFTRWAGVSPKRFLQFLTAEYAKQRLRASEPVLRAALESGLSGPARLYDLLVTTEGVTPGELKQGGQHLHIEYGFHDTPFGPTLLALTRRGLCHLSFVPGGGEGEGSELENLRAQWPNAALDRAPEKTQPLADAIFHGLRSSSSRAAETKPKPLTLFLRGTNFQIRVWNALLRIPPGHLTSYGRLGAAIGLPSGPRAIGSAVARNPIAVLIPCHRVITEGGKLGGYRWGKERKEVLLAWEAAQASMAEKGRNGMG